jgi:multiple sugar transport system permease protein
MTYKLKNKLINGFLIGVPLAVMLVFILGPFYWCVMTSFKMETDIQARPVSYFPPTPTFSNYIYSWQSIGFDVYFRNSLIVACTSMIFVVLLSVLIAYPMTRFQFKGKGAVLLSMLGTQFLPNAMLLIPLFLIFRNLGMLNSLVSVVIAIVTFQFPYNTVLMTGFMSGVPAEVEEAAMIDGCGRLQSLFHIVLPILVPGMVAAGSFAFVSAWKEYLFTLMFITDSAKLTLSVGLSTMLSEFRVAFGYIAAGCCIAMVPPILLFAYIQRYLVSGLSAGAVKG